MIRSATAWINSILIVVAGRFDDDVEDDVEDDERDSGENNVHDSAESAPCRMTELAWRILIMSGDEPLLLGLPGFVFVFVFVFVSVLPPLLLLLPVLFPLFRPLLFVDFPILDVCFSRINVRAP